MRTMSLYMKCSCIPPWPPPSDDDGDDDDDGVRGKRDDQGHFAK